MHQSGEFVVDNRDIGGTSEYYIVTFSGRRLGCDLVGRSEITALEITNLEFMGDGTAKVIVRRSKAEPYGIGRSAHICKGCTKILKKWIDHRNTNDNWLFQPVYKGVAIPRSISCTTVKRLIKNSLKEMGIEDPDAYSGHSLRVGAAQ